MFSFRVLIRVEKSKTTISTKNKKKSFDLIKKLKEAPILFRYYPVCLKAVEKTIVYSCL
jgi:hypothetical protein